MNAKKSQVSDEFGPVVVVDRYGKVRPKMKRFVGLKARPTRSPVVQAALDNFREEQFGAEELAAFALAELEDAR